MTNPPALTRILGVAGLPTTGRFVSKGGWVSRAWVGDEYVVRIGGPAARDAYEHEASVVARLDGTDVPHARHIAHGDGADGAWYVSARLPGRTLHEAWPSASLHDRRTMIESLGTALRSLHGIPAPAGLQPPWLTDALAGGRWPAYHPPVVDATRTMLGGSGLPDSGLPDAGLRDAVDAWITSRLPLFDDDELVLVHGDLHGSNLMVDDGRVSGLIDFAEAVAQPADVELDSILRWCARPAEFPPTPGAQGLSAASLAPVPEWLHGAYPELFARPRLRERLQFYDMWVELAIAVHDADPDVREVSRGRVVRLLDGHDHLDALHW